MSARLLDGKAIAAAVRSDLVSEVGQVAESLGRPPALATVLVGDDPASEVYVANKHRACEEVGISSVHRAVPADVGQAGLEEIVAGLNVDPGVDGILVQLPLPKGLDSGPVIGSLDPARDVDGLTAINQGMLASGDPGLVPCTPAGVIEILDRSGIEISGREAVIVGRSNLVGRPLISLFLGRDATVTAAHSRTSDLAAVCSRADILVAAVGVPGLIGPDHVKPGATVIDVGINRTDEGLVGDVRFDEVAEVAGAITPVPGGVGPMTIAMLLANTVRAAAGRAAEL